jgi:hypothetical protein
VNAACAACSEQFVGSAFLTGPNVTDILLQNQCPSDTVEHVGIAYDKAALQDVFNALDPATATAPSY